MEHMIYCRPNNNDGYFGDCNSCVPKNSTDKTCIASGTEIEPPTQEEAFNYAKSKSSKNIVSVSFKKKDDLSQYTIYDMYENTAYSVDEVVYNYSNRNFFFTYNDFEKFFVLKEFEGSLDTPITSVFNLPSDFGISRVALFKKNNDNTYIGYEKVAKDESNDESYTNSIKAVYKILMNSVTNFNANNCAEVLSRYEENIDIIEYKDEVVCKSSKEIDIVSQNVNVGSQDEKAFELFKNIILGLK